MFFDTDLLVVVGIIFAATAFFWNRSSAVQWVAKARMRAQQAPVADLPFALVGQRVTSRKVALRRMVPAAIPLVPAIVEPVVAPVDEVALGAVTGRLSVDSQVARIAEIVTRAVDGARDADRLHHAAHRQLDAADYALQNLLHELAAVMTMPDVGSARTVKATAVAGVAPAASFDTAMAA
jgi:hypothetical protein